MYNVRGFFRGFLKVEIHSIRFVYLFNGTAVIHGAVMRVWNTIELVWEWSEQCLTPSFG